MRIWQPLDEHSDPSHFKVAHAASVQFLCACLPAYLPACLQDYKGMKQLATLMPDGRISSTIGGQQMVFESPSAFRCAGWQMLSSQFATGRASQQPTRAGRQLQKSACWLLTYPSAGCFCCPSIYLKRLVNPSRKADDGWKTVRYQNRQVWAYVSIEPAGFYASTWQLCAGPIALFKTDSCAKS